ncbi:hypothetical protein H2200_000947 [Cladophialophora chaetospira]|uniref:EthD domain-containing protein n=1 Tax=Cladophialophora chaetospira TaxID=386627 RepID=A0AA38XQB8_9EURO|nr:hypothetical protein H2200_000947 [Cladophialophora chaetospira]
MYTTFAFLVKVPHLATEDFINYYENNHVPLINRLAGPENQPLVYKRRYTHRDDPTHIVAKATIDAFGQPIPAPDLKHITPSTTSSASFATDPGNVDFDVITEVGFAEKEGMMKWMVAVGTGENGRVVAEDEARFLWRERTRAVTVEERVSFG